MAEPITSSRLKAFLVLANGFKVEWAWFFSATLANCSNPTPSWCEAYSIPAWANTPGMSWVPSTPSTGITVP